MSSQNKEQAFKSCHLERSREVLAVVDFVLDCARTDNPKV